jgi:lipopolysaccharide transport system permease protein
VYLEGGGNDAGPALSSKEFDYIVHGRRRLLDFSIPELWQYHELLYYLSLRDLKIRYKQALIGAAWSVLKPLMMMLVFVVIFGLFVKISAGDIPYSIFVYTGLIPWTLVTTVIGTVSASLLSNTGLLTRIYFPRLIIPLSSSIASLVDFAVSLPVLIGLVLWFHIPITWRVLVLPIPVILMFLLSLGIGLWMAALHVKYHDIALLLPIVLQLWLYTSPVIYPVETVSARWLPLYSLNPLVGLLQAFRWGLIDVPGPTPLMMATSLLGSLLVFISGVIFFQYAEDSFADVV